MKSIIRLIVIVLAMFPAISFAQTAKKSWPEMKAFHALMSKTFHPVEEGNYAPLKLKADSLMMAAKAWKESKIPDNYKPEETAKTLTMLLEQCIVLEGAVKAKADDMKLKVLITDAHDIFHKVAGECRKED